MKSGFTLALHIPHSPEREEAEPPEHDVSDTDPSALAHPPAETGRRSKTCWRAQVFSERFTGEMSSQSSSITKTYNNEPPPCCLWAGQCSSVFSWPIRTWTSATMKHLDGTSGLSYCSHRGAEGVGGWGGPARSDLFRLTMSFKQQLQSSQSAHVSGLWLAAA